MGWLVWGEDLGGSLISWPTDYREGPFVCFLMRCLEFGGEEFWGPSMMMLMLRLSLILRMSSFPQLERKFCWGLGLG